MVRGKLYQPRSTPLTGNIRTLPEPAAKGPRRRTLAMR
jgi:hypothetical protein